MQMYLIVAIISGALGVFGPKLLGGGYVKKYTKCVEQKTRQEQKIIKKEEKKCLSKIKKSTRSTQRKLISCDKKVDHYRKEKGKWEKEIERLKITRWGRLDKDKVGKQLVACEKSAKSYEKVILTVAGVMTESQSCWWKWCWYNTKEVTEKLKDIEKILEEELKL